MTRARIILAMLCMVFVSGAPLYNETNNPFDLKTQSRSLRLPMPNCFNHCHEKFWKAHDFKFNEDVSDQFDSYEGLPNKNKWVVTDPPRSGNWYGRQPGLFQAQNVWVRKGHGLVIKAQAYLKGTKEYKRVFESFEKNGYEHYTTGMVSSIRAVRYGYFEVESKTMQTQVVNAWWFSSQTNKAWTEIDVYENLHVSKEESKHNEEMRNKIKPNLHYLYSNLENQKPERLIAANLEMYEHHEPVSWERHVYGLYWTKDWIMFFFNGKLYRRVPNTHWHFPLFVRFNAEINVNWQGVAPNLEELNKKSQYYNVFYFRAWSAQVHDERDTLHPSTRMSLFSKGTSSGTNRTVCEVIDSMPDQDGNLSPFTLHRSL